MKKYMILGVAISVMLFGASAVFAAAELNDWTGVAPMTKQNGLGPYYAYADDLSVWELSITAPQGTGIFQPFVRLQQDGFEAGMNTDAKKDTYNDLSYNQYTRSVKFSDLTAMTLNLPGTSGFKDYYVFALDINEPAGSGLLSLNTFKIYQDSSNDLTTFPTGNGQLVYDMGANAWTQILFDYNVTKDGQAVSDMYAYIPTANFANNPTGYLYLYTEFGDVGGGKKAQYASGDGPEEWRLLAGISNVPEPASLMLLGLGLIGVGAVARRKIKK